jgi:S-layer family protein
MTIIITKTKLALALLAVALLAPAAALATNVFADVDDGAFYAAPVEWAFDNNITTGKTATSFAPLDDVTRGESVTFLKRYNDNIVGPADATLQSNIDANTSAIAGLPVPIAVAFLSPDGGTTVTVTGTSGLTATYDTTADKITVTLAGTTLSPSTSVVLVTPVRINPSSATEDRTVQTFFNSGSVEITVWDASVGGPVINDVAITIFAL